MSPAEDPTFEPSEFAGRVRLFPVPNLVMFPHVMQPLHIFEPRYREMIEDALAGDHLIATAQLLPGWEQDYDGRPPLGPIACLGKIVTHHRMEDGRYNLLLVGLSRVKLIQELPPDRSFREAEAELIGDVYAEDGELRRAELHGDLIACFRHSLKDFDEAREHLEPLLSGEIPLGTLTDIVSYTLNLDQAFKESLLAEPRVDHRAEQLIDYLQRSTEDLAGGSDRFPPDFSLN